MVALRKESVDRNLDTVQVIIVVVESLSARRAWIEIEKVLISMYMYGMSLSARRAWIEIADYVEYNYNNNVALRKESVDRNKMPVPAWIYSKRSLSARRAWIEIPACRL